LKRLSDVLGLKEPTPSGGDQQRSCSWRVKPALSGDPPRATFVEEKDRRLTRLSSDQYRRSLASADVMRFLELNSSSH
jgi:hypothetical protein